MVYTNKKQAINTHNYKKFNCIVSATLLHIQIRRLSLTLHSSLLAVAGLESLTLIGLRALWS